MKNFFLLASLMLCAASCSNESDALIDNVFTDGNVAPVSVHVNDFSVNVEDFSESSGVTRSEETVSSYTGIKILTLAFYTSGGTEICRSEQNKDDNTTYETFGSFSCNLPLGEYTMVVIGRGYYDGDEFTLSSTTSAGYSNEKPRETFCHKQDVTISNSAAVNLSVTMQRICSRLTIVSTDKRGTQATKLRITYAAGGKMFSPATGLATTDTGFSVLFTGFNDPNNTVTVNSYLFLSTNEQTMDVTLEALDASDNVLISKTVSDVPFKRNRVTKLSGAVFTSSSSAISMKVESGWETQHDVNF